MANLVLTDCKLYVGQYDFSGVANQIKLDYNAEMLDATVFNGDGTRKFVPGLRTVSLTGKGLADTEDAGPSLWTDAAMFSRIGADAVPMSVAPVGNAVGDRAFAFQGVNVSYQPLSGEIGTLLEYDLDAQAAGTRLVRGVVLATGIKSATGNGADQALGAVAGGKSIYASLHVVSFTAITSIDVVIESAPAADFVGATTRLTFPQLTNVGWGWQTATAPTPAGWTDTHWRARWTVGGAGAGARIFVVFGIQP